MCMVMAKKWVMNIGKQGLERAKKRMEIHTQETAFVTMKDHKEELRTKKSLECRLIKPNKCDLGRTISITICRPKEDINVLSRRLAISSAC